MIEKRTKIICTIADNRCDADFIRQLYENGMNVVRINSAHASIEGAQQVVDNVRKVSDKIAILIDTKGPEVRLTQMADSVGFVARTGETVEIIDDPSGLCRKGVLYTTYPHMAEDIPVGSDILIDDGSVELSVTDKCEGKLICKVMNEGLIKGHKSVNVPNVHINLPAVTEKDRRFIQWAIKADIDFIAHSFVRSAKDLQEIQSILDAENSHLKIISKIENQQGVDNLDEILSYCYGVMVARGDLGVEIPAERIPLIQRDIVKACRSRKKPVIIATQMLQSMIDNPRPTRAEVTDVANAIFQSSDAIMLSQDNDQDCIADRADHRSKSGPEPEKGRKTGSCSSGAILGGGDTGTSCKSLDIRHLHRPCRKISLHFPSVSSSICDVLQRLHHA